MNSDERWFPSHLGEFGTSECLELLAARQIGRVAYGDELGPLVLPVNYELDHGFVLIQLSPPSTLARRCMPRPRPSDRLAPAIAEAGRAWSSLASRWGDLTPSDARAWTRT